MQGSYLYFFSSAFFYQQGYYQSLAWQRHLLGEAMPPALPKHHLMFGWSGQGRATSMDLPVSFLQLFLFCKYISLPIIVLFKPVGNCDSYLKWRIWGYELLSKKASKSLPNSDPRAFLSYLQMIQFYGSNKDCTKSIQHLSLRYLCSSV